MRSDAFRRSVAVVLRLEGTLGRDAEVARLLLRELRELHAELAEVERGDLLVELLREGVDLLLVLCVIRPELDLRKRLVRERRAHDERRVTVRAAEVHEA